MKNSNVMDKISLKCVGCGLCEGICPTKCIEVGEISNKGLKPIVDKNRCVDCGICVDVCPTIELKNHENINSVKKVYGGVSKNSEVIKNSASGGIVSSILYSLFEEEKIDGAVVAFFDDKLNVYGDFITSKDEILKHSGSFFQTSKMLLNIGKIKKFKSVVFVGLPCHNIALKKFINKNNIDNIFLSISLVCSIGRMKNGIIEFINEISPDFEIENMKRYKSRFGEQRPGRLILENSSSCIDVASQKYYSDKDYFYLPEGCLFCKKLYGVEYSDISVGDNWGIVSKVKNAIFSINTERVVDILEGLKIRSQLEEKSVDDLINSQPIGYKIKYRDRKKFNKTIRILKFFYRLFPKNKYSKKIFKRFRSYMFRIFLK